MKTIIQVHLIPEARCRDEIYFDIIEVDGSWDEAKARLADGLSVEGSQLRTHAGTEQGVRVVYSEVTVAIPHRCIQRISLPTWQIVREVAA
ncbi:hypothetical protein AN189_12970 [Loktanella sp. 3ANDIMAR09]|uniref:hypothetical protein n=1 Tax=Loktanella sp. 3ANDIMAR09 TaxID=1225657 RepID=UPI0006FF7FD6|nr:hypothetical protein [Loktanella sp. 3ANDIMAR09]KQI67982.1 hypothetical protein AN189_12970 [Loktanella sp. 3ANDIMAR09]